MRNPPELKTKNGWVIFDAPTGGTLTSQSVKAEQRSADEEEYLRAFLPGARGATQGMAGFEHGGRHALGEIGPGAVGELR